MPALPPAIDPLALFVTLPPFTSSTAPYLVLVMLPSFVMVPTAPVTNTPNELPEIDPVRLLPTPPPSARSMPAPAVPVAVIVAAIVPVHMIDIINGAARVLSNTRFS